MGDIKNVKKACGFYVSSMHLATMILPYIKNQINKNVKIETVLEYNLKENIQSILSNLFIKEEERKKILNINWENNKIQKYNSIEKRFKNIFEKNSNVIILVSGKRKYIEEANQVIDKYFNKNIDKVKEKNIIIINIYEVVEFDDNIREILDVHDYIINTAGMHKIEDIFEDYKGRIAN